MSRVSIVFVHLGPSLPQWLPDAVNQARRFNSGRIFVIADAAAFKDTSGLSAAGIERVALQELPISPVHKAFRDISPFDKGFREGFWNFTTERFFCLEAAMRQLALTDVIHLENDVMLYRDLETLAPKLAALYPGLAATFDNDQRCVPGILYVPRADAIGKLNEFIVGTLQQLRRQFPADQVALLNDMILIGQFRARGPAAIDNLPIVTPNYPAALRSPGGHIAADPANYSRNFDELQTIFDAAALGQFLGGVDPRNTSGSSEGFINESCVFDARVQKPSFTTDTDGRRIPIVETVGGKAPVANLHIHSKKLSAFMS